MSQRMKPELKPYLSPFNLCNLPSWAVASRRYNEHPQPLEIQGTHHLKSQFLDALVEVSCPVERGSKFHDFMDVTFQLHQWAREESQGSRKSLKNSYLRFIRGWLFDSNSVAGAVLKGWVESRFGLVPTFHRECIRDVHSEAYYRYLVDRMQGAARTSAVLSQLDLLYEYVQYELPRLNPGQTHLTLYRGIYDFDEHPLLEQLGKNRYFVLLNNLNSFTGNFEHAWEFGSRVLRVQIPLPKIFFRCGILPKSLLKGEDEYLVIGGEYAVDVLTGG